MSQPPELKHLVPVPTGKSPLPAADVDGCDLLGRPQRLRLQNRDGRWTLLLFLGSRCDGCFPFWPSAAAPEALGLESGDAAVIVTRAPANEDTVALADLVARGRTGEGVETPAGLFMSDQAWDAYQVHGPPFFVLVDGEKVATEGVAWGVEQVAADVARVRQRVRR